jgi:hypothetical protein
VDKRCSKRNDDAGLFNIFRTVTIVDHDVPINVVRIGWP